MSVTSTDYVHAYNVCVCARTLTQAHCNARQYWFTVIIITGWHCSCHRLHMAALFTSSCVTEQLCSLITFHESLDYVILHYRTTLFMSSWNYATSLFMSCITKQYSCHRTLQNSVLSSYITKQHCSHHQTRQYWLSHHILQIIIAHVIILWKRFVHVIKLQNIIHVIINEKEH